MTQRRPGLLRIASVVIVMIGGCCAPRHSLAHGRSDLTVPATTTAPSAPAHLTVRVGGPDSVGCTIASVSPSANAFPDVWTRVENRVDEDVVVTYGPMSVIVHCGPYVRLGKNNSFPPRRQLLAPTDWLIADPPTGRWIESADGQEVQLMIPSRLPPGKYSVWVTYLLGDDPSSAINSETVDYEVDAPAAP